MKIKSIKTIGRLVKKSPVEFALIIFMTGALFYATLPTQAGATESSLQNLDNQIQAQIAVMQNEVLPYGELPVADKRSPVRSARMPVTAYNSVPWQTDSTPCIGAQGTDICAYLEAGSNTCAANFVPLGTVLEVEDLGTCVVRDRMNARYYYRVDWYMGMDIASAKSFGVQYKEIGIYPS